MRGAHQHRLGLVRSVDEGVAALQSLAQRGHLRRVPDDPAQLEHLPHAPGQLEAVEALQVLLREPVQPAAVEAALAARDRLQLEPLRELPEQRRTVRDHRARQLREVVEQRLGRVTLAAQLGDRGRTLALRELRARLRHQQRGVREPRLAQAERVEQRDLARGVGQVVLAPDDVRDLHQRVVHGSGELVGGRAVGAHDHEVLDGADRDAHVAAGRVVHHDVVGRRAEVDGAVLAVRAALVHQAVGVLQVDRHALGLPVRAVRAALVRALVEPQAEPLGVPAGWCARSGGSSAPDRCRRHAARTPRRRGARTGSSQRRSARCRDGARRSGRGRSGRGHRPRSQDTGHTSSLLRTPRRNLSGR